MSGGSERENEAIKRKGSFPELGDFSENSIIINIRWRSKNFGQ